MVNLGCRSENLAVIGNGVDRPKFMPRPRLAMREKMGLPNDRRIVIAVGQLNENKGFDILIDAVARLRSTGIMLVIVGEGPLRSSLERQIRALGLAQNVRLIGTVAHS